MALIAERWGLIPDLRRFAADGYPIWGTCAGLIFLADRATGRLSIQNEATMLHALVHIHQNIWAVHSAFVPERSNGVDLKSIVETLVGSNPTGREFFVPQARKRGAKRCWAGLIAWCSAITSVPKYTVSRLQSLLPPVSKMLAPIKETSKLCSFELLLSWTVGKGWKYWPITI